jgi:asparagine synthase (glutamine-hydrolysing)
MTQEVAAMCGVAGIYALDPRARVPAGVATRMADTMHHRGPDDSGAQEFDTCALAHRRLTIIDLSRRARQPLADEREQTWLSFNGEIYNFQSLRAGLHSGGHSFRSATDSEVIVHLYEDRGVDLVHELEGMFAFALWDQQQDRLLLARDRLGIKPLFWARGGDHGEFLVFASEVKAILASGLVATRPNAEAIGSYLRFRHAVSPLTMFEGIHQLRAGHRLVAQGGEFHEERYWKLHVPAEREDRGEAFYIDGVRRLVGSAVEQRLVSDVPIGAYLSGGLDSSVIVAEMAERLGPRLKTFSIGFGDSSDELGYAKLVADRYATDHTEVILDSSRYLDLLPELIHKRDSPLGVPNEVALYELSRVLKQDITVVLSGEGADEIFAGYGDYIRTAFDYRKARLAGALPAPLRRLVSGEMPAKYEGLDHFDSPAEHFLAGYKWFTASERSSLLRPEIRALLRDRAAQSVTGHFDEYPAGTYYDRVLYTLEQVHLQNLLARVDSMTMATAVEARVPFVDHRLVEFATAMPLHYKMRWRSPLHRARAWFSYSDVFRERDDTTKWVLRQAYADRVPGEIVERRKVGFKVPLERSFHGDIVDHARDVLLDDGAVTQTVLDRGELERWLRDGQEHRGEFGQKVWMLVNLELWFRQYFPDGETLADGMTGATPQYA